MLLQGMAEIILAGIEDDAEITIDSDRQIEFFTKNIDRCREYLLARETGEETFEEDEELGFIIDLDWDYIIEEVAAALTLSSNYRNFFICENNRPFQVGIEATLWVATAVAAIYSAGSGGAAVQGARAAVTQSAKNLVGIGVRKGVRTAVAETAARRAGLDVAAATAEKAAARAAVRTAAADFNRNSAVVFAKGQLRGRRASKSTLRAQLEHLSRTSTVPTRRTAAQDALRLLDNFTSASARRRAANATLRQAAAATKALNQAMARFAISTPIAAAGGIATVYSFVESGFNPQIMNCIKIRQGSGCYLSCKESLGSPTDDLNTKVFKPIFGKNLCVDEDSGFILREIQSQGLPIPGDAFILKDATKWDQAKQTIKQQVADKGNCDWAARDVDLYVGAPLWDPSTLEPQDDGVVGLLIDGIRIDD